MGILSGLIGALLSGNSKSPSEMSDKELKRKLDKSAGKNTGESIATRANYIKEANKRGIDHKKG